MSSNGNVEKYQCSKNNGAWEDCSNQITINTDGEVTYKFRAITTGGLTTNETKTYEIKRDTVGPTFELNVSVYADVDIIANITEVADKEICK